MFTGNEGQIITLADASDLTKKFRDEQSEIDYIKGEFFGVEKLQSILNQVGCVGIRIYYGVKASGDTCLVLVGATTDENDMCNNNILEQGITCPPTCGVNNQLNS